MGIQCKNIAETLLHQLHNYWPGVDEKIILSAVPTALDAIQKNYEGLPNKRFFDGKDVHFTPLMSVQWMNFLYRLSHVLYKNGELYYSTIGENVILFANATVLGDTKIGNNVIVSADTYLINEDIPDNSVVFGKSPAITIKNKSEDEIKRYTQHIWGWEI